MDTITLLATAENWEREKLQQLKSNAQEAVRAAKANLKRMEQEMKGRAAQRRLDRKAATLTKLEQEAQEAAEAQRDQNSDKLEEISSLMNEESRNLAEQVEELDEAHSKLAEPGGGDEAAGGQPRPQGKEAGPAHQTQQGG